MGRNKKGWCYQNQSIEEYKYWLTSHDLSKEQNWSMATQYAKFCNSFKGHLIPDAYSMQYISDIQEGPFPDSFYVEFSSEEIYLLANGKFFSPVLKHFVEEPLTHKDVAIVPNVEKFDWRIQELNVQTALEYFETANVFKNTRKHKFTDEAKEAAVKYYLARCSMESNRIIENLGIDNVLRIDIFRYHHFTEKYCFKFHFKNPKEFYYFGYEYWDSKFGVW